MKHSDAASTSAPLEAFQPIVRQSVNEAVYQALRNKLMHGEYRAGQVLGIQYLADALGTSTMPVREALRRLVAQQGLEPLPNGTTRVPLITKACLSDIRRARVLIEGTVTEWAGPLLTSSVLDQLEQLAQEITQERRTPKGVASSLEKNRIFHFTIYAAAQSPVMLAMIESLWLQSGAYLRETRELLHNEDSSDQLHESTVNALRAGNFAQARQYIQEDVSWIFDRLDLTD
ncbi:GntR family transcriptional regulator [Alcaligenes faecalis]|jgi:DNA-binding GntR family transcriptional regulator|uniref:GntR family transcriptional regulator n=1 Tax=Alcaligenes faecalis TaxID=511 RepID=A0ABY7N1L0_ALCFA|nr:MULTISPECIES: GntR family transcriptional regulator [Alcaligenes]ALO38910.1 GntR family transcriptional regulator [Alcaligenes faecalis]ARP55359.1 GntR family transcriptional regulator [Alcaligenes faecalis]ATI01178.1 GntR family transcriptional regulator [Alcaligenes faecalis]AYZ90535.1 GntR family transcriptional regulator [Alcaligenes faecalis]KAA1286097.1 GntR family transcriptional regulator [Alcaligenes faecalis]